MEIRFSIIFFCISLVFKTPYSPYLYERSFSVGSIKDKDGKIAGPGSYMVEKVELYVNPGKVLTNSLNPNILS